MLICELNTTKHTKYSLALYKEIKNVLILLVNGPKSRQVFVKFNLIITEISNMGHYYFTCVKMGIIRTLPLSTGTMASKGSLSHTLVQSHFFNNQDTLVIPICVYT